MKKVISVFLAVLIIVTMLPLSAFAENEDGYTTETEQEVSYNATNALGDVLADAMNESESETEKNNFCFIQSVEINGLEAEVVLSAKDSSTVVVAVYDEDTNVMVTSGKAEVDSETETVTVELAECEMPEYFIIKAFLLNSENEPLCKSYESLHYTKAFEEFFEKTVFDFDEEKVINLDYGYDSNFAVVSDDAKVTEQSSEENILTTNDYDNGIYVFENANEEITSLKEGDVLYFVYGDGAEDYILTKVGTIENKKGTVTITTADEYEISDFFSYIKIDSDKMQNEQPQTFAMARGFDDDSGSADDYSGEFSIDFKKSYDLGEYCKVSFSGTFKAKFYLQFYYDFRLFGADYYELTQSTTVTASGSTTIKATTKDFEPLKLYDGKIPVFSGIEAEVVFSLKISVSAEISATGTLEAGLVSGAKKIAGRPDEDISKEPYVKLKLDISGKVSFSVTPSVSVGFRILKVFKVEIGVDAGFDISGTIKMFSLDSAEGVESREKHDCSTCVDGDIKLNIRGFIKFSFGINVEKQKTVLEITLGKATMTLGDFYISIQKEYGIITEIKFGFGLCPNIKHKVSVLVKDSHENKLSNVIVNDEFVTDENGVAELYLKNGKYEITAKTLDGETVSQYITVKDKDEYVDLIIKRCLVTVTVTDAEHNPLPNVKVNDEYFTDGVGQVQFFLTSGIHTITAVNSEGVSASQTIEIYDDNEKSVDIVVSKCKVRVTVVDADGKPIPLAAVNGIATNLDGVVELDLPKGTHTITAIHDGITSEQEITIDKEKEMNLTIVLGKCKVTVTVLDAEGNPVAGAMVNDEYVTDNKGVTEIYLANGTHVIKVTTDSFIKKLEIKIDGENEKSLTVVMSDNKCGDNLYWELHDDGELVICGYGSMYNFHTANYTSYAPWSDYSDLIKKVTIYNGATSIGNYAFDYCYSLTCITIPDSVTSIGNYAFNGCEVLTNITIPDNVTSIGRYAFYGCSSITSIAIPNCVKSIREYSFCRCNAITSIILPDSVTSIEEHAFAECFSLTNVIIPNGVKSIESGAFADCFSLLSITIPDSVTSIGDAAFLSCASITSIVIPDSVTNLGDRPFKFCDKLKSVTIGNNVTSIGEEAFYYCEALTSIIIPNSVTIFKFHAFEGCNALKTVYYIGTEESWGKISISSDNSCLTNAEIIYNYTPTEVSDAKYLSSQPVVVSSESGLSVTASDAIIGNEYVMLIVKDENAEDLLASDNLLYIDQKTAVSENLIFEFNLNDDVSEYYTLFYNADLSLQNDCNGHTPGLWEVVVEAHVGVDGLEQQKCTVCGEVLDERVIPALPDVSYMTGDANGDGKVTAADARLVLRISAKLDKSEDYNLPLDVFDVTGDSKITAADARKILRIAAKLES